MVSCARIACAVLIFSLQSAAFGCAFPPASPSHYAFLSSAISPRHLAASVAPRFDWQQIVSGIDRYIKLILSRADTNTGSHSERNETSNILYGFPTAQDLNLSVNLVDVEPAESSQLALTSPSYGNWTEHGWELRFRGSLYRQPEISKQTVDRFARIFRFHSFVATLCPASHAHLMNMIRGLFMVPQRNVELSFHLQRAYPEQFRHFDGQHFSFPAIGDTCIDTPYSTNFLGDYDFSYPLSGFFDKEAFLPGDETSQVQVVNVRGNRTETGHTLAYLVPSSGHTIVSDVDDVLRVATICQMKEGLKNLLTRPFYPWMNMPDVFANWTQIPGVHFHYVTTSPKQMGQSYMDYVFDHYPAGSFDVRVINASDVRSSLSTRRFMLERILQTFPERKFTLVGDSTNQDIMTDFPHLAKKYSDRVQCLLVRNTTATDPGHWVPYNTKRFRDLDQENYMFFRVPDDLVDLDIANGHCYNSSVPQNLTFGWQGYPFPP